MDLSFGLAALALFVIAGALMILAGVGVFVICVAAWRSFTCWIAASHVAEERQRARVRLKREKRIAAEREEAMLKGASAVATDLVRTVVQSQLQHLASREAEHRQQVIQLALLLARNQNLPHALVGDVLNPSCEPMEALPMVAPTDPQPRRRGLISLVRSMLFAGESASQA
jgi:hypothetical protein